MSIRNNTYFRMLVTGVVLLMTMPNLVWADNWDNQNKPQIRGHFGIGMDEDLSSFNELAAVVTKDNYAEVELERSISGDVYIEQGSGLSGNKAKVVQSDSDGSRAGIWQYGADNTALITQSGTGNQAYIQQYNYGNEAWINQNGDNNIAAMVQYGLGISSSISINQRGDNNQAYIVDYGGSNYGISQNGNDYVAIVGGYGLEIYVTQQ